MSWRSDLVAKYPHLFGNPASGSPSVGDGWRLIVEKAIGRIDDAVRGPRENAEVVVRIAQIKEKMGSLRLYVCYNPLPPEIEEKIRDAIDLAEARADSTCELCGSVGRLYDRRGWYLTRCERHAEGELVPEQQNDRIHISYAFTDGAMRVVKCLRYDRDSDSFVDAPLPPGGDWNDKR